MSTFWFVTADDTGTLKLVQQLAVSFVIREEWARGAAVSDQFIRLTEGTQFGPDLVK